MTGFRTYPTPTLMGEWEQATARVVRFLSDLPVRWDGRRVLVLGHVATCWGLECALNGADVRALVQSDLCGKRAGVLTRPVASRAAYPKPEVTLAQLDYVGARPFFYAR